MIRVDVRNASGSAAVPTRESFRRWASAALRREGELSVYIVGEDEGMSLNETYRGQRKATNVLSFAGSFEQPLPGGDLFGDLVFCAPVIAREARQQNKPADAHWAHLTVHGSLHLLGHDHVEDEQAQRMEALEVEILRSLGYGDPYEVHLPQGERAS